MSLWDTSMVHKQGITPVSDQHLQRRNGVYYYRRRVPFHLVAKFGKKFVQFSLHTNNLKEAKSLRTLRDLEWDAKFAACLSSANGEPQLRLDVEMRGGAPGFCFDRVIR